MQACKSLWLYVLISHQVITIKKIQNRFIMSNKIKKSNYETALNETAEILLDYDTDKLVPLYGFGAIVNSPEFSSKNNCHHCFPLNFNK